MISQVEIPESHRLVCRVTLHQSLGMGTKLFESTAEAQGLPLVQGLLALEGVRSVVARGDLLLVGRDPDSPWEQVLPRIQGLADGDDDQVDEQHIWDAVWAVLDEQINPSVASHGGSIELAEVRGRDIVLVMRGGCQGCSAAGLTLRGGVEQALRASVPQVGEISDITDHGAGHRPFYA